MTFKELEWKKVKELISPYMEFSSNGGWVNGCFDGFIMFTYFGEHNMSVHFIDFNKHDWTFEVCKNYFDVLRLLPKVKETFLEIKFPGYHDKLKRIQNDF